MPRLLVGIDLGSHFTKIVEIEYTNKPLITEAFLFPTPFLTATQEKKINLRQFFDELTKVIPLKRLQSAKIGINIPSFSITALPILLPHMPPKELIFAAINEAKRRMLPASGPNHLFECIPLGEKIIGNLIRLEALVIRTDKVTIDGIISLFKEFDLSPSLITPTAFAILNLLPKDTLSKEEDAVFVDLGASSLSISVCRQTKLYFTRDVAYGFKDIIGDFSRQLGIAPTDVEKSIKEIGIPEVTFDLKNKVAIAEEIMRQKYEAGLKQDSDKGPEINLLELRMLWQPHIERIIHELRRSFTYYKEESGGRRIGYIYFYGGGSQTKNLMNTLGVQIGGQCQLILPFRDLSLRPGIGLSDKSSTSIFANATALALTVLNEVRKKPTINFLPMELKRKELLAARRLIILVVEICVVCILALASLNLLASSYSIKKSIEKEEFELIRIKRVVNRMKDLGEKEKEINRLFSYVQKLEEERCDFAPILRALAEHLPKEIWLNRLEVLKSSSESEVDKHKAGPIKWQIKIKGRLFADYEKALEILGDFKKKLEQSSYFINVSLNPLELEDISSKRLVKKEEDFLITPARLREFSLIAEVRPKR